MEHWCKRGLGSPNDGGLIGEDWIMFGDRRKSFVSFQPSRRKLGSTIDLRTDSGHVYCHPSPCILMAILSITDLS